jgi:hypothetical protein
MSPAEARSTINYTEQDTGESVMSFKNGGKGSKTKHDWLSEISVFLDRSGTSRSKIGTKRFSSEDD